MSRLALFLVGSALAAGVAATAAETCPCGGAAGKGMHGDRGAMWKQFDKDGDGTLSDQEKADMKAEWQTRREARRKEMLAKFDKDGDGALSDQEKAEARTARAAEMRKKIFAELDKDADGKVSAAEVVARLEEMRARWDGAKALEGKLTDEEKAAMKSVAQKWVQEMIGKFDADGDGMVSEAEFAAGMDAVREQFRKAHGQYGQ